MPLPLIEPPLINSANPWATTVNDLQALFDCSFTGAVTTRTTLPSGFEHDPTVHQYTFFNPEEHSASSVNARDKNTSTAFRGSLNTLGYSPLPLSAYLAMISQVVSNSKLPEDIKARKAFIISVTGSPEAVVECYRKIQDFQLNVPNPLCMEVNLSCPNIPGRPPPAYSKESLIEYLHALANARRTQKAEGLAIGVKTPPYTYHDQFKTLVETFTTAQEDGFLIDFITATNTLGSCLVLEHEDGTPVLNSSSGTGIGGLGGSPLHPLALGNVKTIRSMIDRHEVLQGIDIIGIGGVGDRAGFNRMRAVGAKVVGVGTALGSEGIGIFKKILQE